MILIWPYSKKINLENSDTIQLHIKIQEYDNCKWCGVIRISSWFKYGSTINEAFQKSYEYNMLQALNSQRFDKMHFESHVRLSYVILKLERINAECFNNLCCNKGGVRLFARCCLHSARFTRYVHFCTFAQWIHTSVWCWTRFLDLFSMMSCKRQQEA